MVLSADALAALLRELLPIAGRNYELLLTAGAPAASEHEPAGQLTSSLDLVTFESLDGQRSIRDYKQQEVCVVPRARREDDARVAAYLRAWARVLPSTVDALGWDIDATMPSDLFFPEALDDAALQTESDFAAALSDADRIRAWFREAERRDLREGLSRWGLADRVDEIIALRRPAIRFDDHMRVDDESRDEPTPVGATRFGGEPDLPPGLEWPMTSEGRPMTFVGQLDLASLRGFAAAKELPAAGLLSFFYDWMVDVGVSKTLELPARVLHVTASRGELERRATPPGGDRRPEFTVEARGVGVTMPLDESPFYEALLPVESVVAFRRACRDAASGGTGRVVNPLEGFPRGLWEWTSEDVDDFSHRLLGYAVPFQGDVYLTTEVYSTGRGFADWDEGSPAAVAVHRASRRWRLLLQVRAQVDGVLLVEQDGGDLYFMIPEDALAAHDWTRVFCTLQCG